MKEGTQYASLYYIGQSPQINDKKLIKGLSEKERSKTGIVEKLFYNALTLKTNVIGETQFEDRVDFERFILSKNQLASSTSLWNLSDGLWIKDMSLMKLGRKNVVQLTH